ncbi:hypothetical protein OG589_14585 [Sphaerisporangium sp. NBC_01403]|uniref:hypothetical protein n=1 Tax=Sphaerisporangium sp. NBC_01403 TaxID=2903599 RepID=UPI00324597AA
MTDDTETSLVAAVRADLNRWSIPADSAMAASALDLAERLGVDDIRPAAAAMLHAQLRATLGELAKVATLEEKAGDPVDEINAQREKRRRGA